ncbi:unnamed protein product [Ixodes persulcatus]
MASQRVFCCHQGRPSAVFVGWLGASAASHVALPSIGARFCRVFIAVPRLEQRLFLSGRGSLPAFIYIFFVSPPPPPSRVNRVFLPSLHGVIAPHFREIIFDMRKRAVSVCRMSKGHANRFEAKLPPSRGVF